MEFKRHVILLLTVLLALIQAAAADFPKGDAGMFLAVLILCLVILAFTGTGAILYFVVYRRMCGGSSRSADI